jgi:putative drug exporter of the RND superfamily
VDSGSVEEDPGKRGRLERIGLLAVRHPRRIVAVWAAAVAILTVMGLGLDGKLSISVPVVEGSAPQRANSTIVREFGHENALVVLLRGPHAAVERQGRRLERRLDALADTEVISPWTAGGSIEGLMPRPGEAGIVVSVENLSEDDATAFLPPLRERIEETVGSPVRFSIAGAPAIGESFLSATKQAALDGERIAVPLLLIVLLLVFRSVAAAAVPVLIGGAVVGATRGIMDILVNFTELSFLALGAVGMMGLALGVDYSLLVVSRFREEMAKGAEPADAVPRTVAAIGPTVVMAGAGISVAMAAASQLLPGVLISSVSIAVIAAAAISVLSALLVTPAVLVLLGPRLERWSLPHRTGGDGLAAAWASRLSRRPRLVVLPVVAFLMASAIWAFTLDTEVEAVALLPSGDPGRVQQEEVQGALGPGWIAPYEIVMDGGSRPVTTRSRLRALAAFQHRVEADPGVATMTGFAEIERATRQLGGLEEALVEQRRGLARLNRGLSRAHDGSARGTEGLAQAADGARRLDIAIGATGDGAGLLAKGLDSAGTGSERLAGGLDRASGGSGKLASGARKASAGAGRLESGLSRAEEQTGEIASSARLLENAMTDGEQRVAEVEGSIDGIEAQLAATLDALRTMTVGRGDPQYTRALEAAEGASASVGGTDEAPEGLNDGVSRAAGQFSLGLYLAERLGKSGRDASEGMAKLARGSERLDRGLEKLASGSRKVSVGISRLAEGGQALSPGLERLGIGAERLAEGLDRIGEGTAGLAGGLGGGAQKSKLLTGALSKMNAGVERQRDESGVSSKELDERSPGLFDSGYFYLASLDGSAPERRGRAGFLVNLDRGGHAARMLVIPRQAPVDDRAAETRQRIEGDAARLAEDTGTTVMVGGATPDQLELDAAFREDSGLARVVLVLITILILVPLMRSVTMPVVAALLNLLTVAATFGLLSLLFNGSLLGGPGFVDASVIPVTIVVIFALAIDYEVFIFARMREEYERTGSHRAAIDEGLQRTAPVITGAALIMIMVFLAFATSPFITFRGFGVAQAIAVAIDAFVVRLVIVPAVMRAMGPWAWWMPRWLDRLLPGGSRAPGPSRGTA